ncbi:MAG TPA: hypothetical protein VGM12_22820 [Trebonia sp.]|jgi:hypothetical protein
MQPLTAPGGTQATRGRWIWRLSGALTVSALGVLTAIGTFAVLHSPSGQPVSMSAVPTRMFTVAGPVTALSVQSYGAPIKVTTVPGNGPAQVAEAVTFNSFDGSPPAVTHGVSHGLLTLSAPACATFDCSVAFAVTVPAGVTVNAVADGGQVTLVGTGAATVDSGGGSVFASGISGPLSVNAEGGDITVNKTTAAADLDSGGGPVSADGVAGKLTVHAEGGGITVSGAPSAYLDSGGGPVYASAISGPLTVSGEGGGVTVTGAGATTIDSGGGPVSATTIRGPLAVTAEGGDVQANDVTGALTADTGGGQLTASGLTSASASVDTGGSDGSLGFTAAPASVRLRTGGGNATVAVPGGPYAVTADSSGSPQSVSVATSPGAASSISVSTEGGNLQIGPA